QTCYYIVGDKRTLLDEQVLIRGGGFLGVGRTLALNPQVSMDELTPVNKYKVSVIPFKGNAPEIITNHPPESYRIEKVGQNANRLVITDPDKFWDLSSCLVVATNNKNTIELATN